MTRKRTFTISPRRSNFFINNNYYAVVREETTEEKLNKVPLEQDETFLKTVKSELLGLRKRIRHETLQKLELLKQIKQYREKEQK